MLYVPAVGRRAAVAAGLVSVVVFPLVALALLRGAPADAAAAPRSVRAVPAVTPLTIR